MKLTKFISEVPSDLFKNASNEIDSIDWESLDDGRTKRTIAFATSKSIQIRIHKQPKVMLDNVHDWGKIVDTEDHPLHVRMYPNSLKLAHWILLFVKVISLTLLANLQKSRSNS